eukprot:759911-Hanusia_phi.AAC.4
MLQGSRARSSVFWMLHTLLVEQPRQRRRNTRQHMPKQSTRRNERCKQPPQIIGIPVSDITSFSSLLGCSVPQDYSSHSTHCASASLGVYLDMTSVLAPTPAPLYPFSLKSEASLSNHRVITRLSAPAGGPGESRPGAAPG